MISSHSHFLFLVEAPSPGHVDEQTKEVQSVQETVGIPKDGELPAGAVFEHFGEMLPKAMKID